MNMKKITIPKPADVIDNGKVVQTISFRDFMERVFTNPMWMDNWKHGRAQLAISQSLAQAIERGEDFFVVSEEDWHFLDMAVKTPLSARNDGSVLKGFGYLPQYTRYVVPLSNAIIEAEKL
jgi:hypothetical protein